MNDLSEMFAQARDADIEAVAGVRLFRAGKRLRGECPMCGASKGKKNGGAFSVDPHARVFKCWGCDEGGDVIDLEQLLRGGSAREAAERLVGAPVPTSRATQPRTEPRRVEGPSRLSGPERLAREIFTACAPTSIGETPAGRYFLGRGISPLVIARLAGRLFFNPAAKWGWDEDRGDWIRAPAIVGKVRTPEGPTGGVHVTYLAADCSRKAALEPAKRMWGPQRDAEGRPGAVWLLGGGSSAPLIVAEGIESGLSAAQLHDGPCRLVAALSLNALQGGWSTDKWGRIDPASVTSDPERPAFTWPDQPEVMIAVDRDMKPIRRKVRKIGGGTAEIELDAEARARICAGLAVQAWKRAGSLRVRAIAPAAGRDFNDELRERGA